MAWKECSKNWGRFFNCFQLMLTDVGARLYHTVRAGTFTYVLINYPLKSVVDWRSIFQRTELGTAKLVLTLLELLSQITCAIDYLHETRMHRNDAIYQTHYGGFLQAFHCRLKQKRILGEPVKKIQLHEKFLYIVDRAHHHVRMKKYLEGRLPSDFLPLEGESCHKFVLRHDKRYLWWCNN